MKTIIFACAVILFTSCSKGDINLNGSGSGWGSDWNLGGFNITGDTSNKVKADIDINGATSHISAVGLSAYFSRYALPQYSDSSITTISAFDSGWTRLLKLDLINIKTPGTYSFGHIPGGHNQEIRASYTIQNSNGNIGIDYYNDANVPSGSITITDLTNRHIQGSFSITCWNGTAAANIRNGSFTGNY